MPSEKKCEELVQSVAQRAPWTFAGYSVEILNQWTRDANAMINSCKEFQANAGKKSDKQA